MAQPGVVVIKSFNYRGAYEEWSNAYHLSGAASGPSQWRDWADALIALEKHVYTSRVTIRRVLCYDDTDANSVYTYDLSAFAGVVTGDLDMTDFFISSGDDAGWVRWDTGRVSSSGKKIYLRKYFHDVYYQARATPDEVASDQQTAYQAFGDALLGDILTGLNMVGPDGSQPTGDAGRSSYLTTRTLKRRGRRP